MNISHYVNYRIYKIKYW